MEEEAGPGGTWSPYAFRIAPGEWAKHDLASDSRFVAYLVRSAMNINLRQGPGKMTLLFHVYLSIQFRIRSASDNWEQSWRVRTLLKGADIEIPTNPKEYRRFRTYVQEGLDALTVRNDDASPNLLASWQYDRCSEDEPTRGWFPGWLEYTVKIVPNPDAIEPYRKIAQHRKSALAKTRKN